MTEVKRGNIKVLIVDDHNLVAEAIKAMLEPYSQIEVVGYTKNAADINNLIEIHHPQVVLMDITLQSMSGIDATKDLKRKHSPVKVIMLSMHESSAYIAKAIQAGANGYLLKNIEKEELYTAINTVCEGQFYFSKSIAPDVVSNALTVLSSSSTSDVTITKREKEILSLIIQGFTNKEIAEKLTISKRTVDVHREHIMKKCNAKNSIELIHVVNELNLLA